MEEREFELDIECYHCGTINSLPDEMIDAIQDAIVEVEELSIGIEDTVCTDDAVDYIFDELVKDGFAPTAGAIRAVLRYFHGFVVENMKLKGNEG